MAQVGAVLCDIIRGWPPTQKQRSDRWVVPGINGEGIQLTGLGDSDFEVTLVRYGNQATVTTWFWAIEALQGTIVSIFDNLGANHANKFIQSVSQPQIRAAQHEGGYRGEMRLQGYTV